MPPAHGDSVPSFEALLCTGETFQSTAYPDAYDGGSVLVFFGFAFSAIDENWWKRYERAGWHEFDVPVIGVSRDGPYAQNAFIRYLDSPFDMYSDTNGAAMDAFDIRTPRDGMANTAVPMRSVFVVDDDLTVQYRWIADDWISPVPREEIEAAVEEL